MAIPWSGFPLAKLVEAGEAAVVGEIPRDADVPGLIGRAGPAADLVSVALHRRADDRGGDQRARVPRRPAPTASRCRSRWARRCASRCRGSTASSRSNRSTISVSPISGRRVSGRRCRRPSTASGPTSIRRCRIRAGARRPRKTSRTKTAPADLAVQRLRRICRRPLQGAGEGTALGVMTSRSSPRRKFHSRSHAHEEKTGPLRARL